MGELINMVWKGYELIEQWTYSDLRTIMQTDMELKGTRLFMYIDPLGQEVVCPFLSKIPSTTFRGLTYAAKINILNQYL